MVMMLWNFLKLTLWLYPKSGLKDISFVLKKAEYFLLGMEKGVLGGRSEPGHRGLEGCPKGLRPLRQHWED